LGSVTVALKKVALMTIQAAMKRSPSNHPILSCFVRLSSSTALVKAPLILLNPDAPLCAPGWFCADRLSPLEEDDDGGKDARPFFSSRVDS
jgi:hypothetical protein